MADQEEQAIFRRMIAKCWTDEAFKQRLLSNPKPVLKEIGVDVPEDLEVKTVENTDKVFHLVIPAKPDKLSDEDLVQVAAGGFRW